MAEHPGPAAPAHGMPPAEQEVDRDRARRLLAADPDLAGRPLRRLGVGWDNTVWLVDERWTARFPRRASALPLLRSEVAVLTALRDAGPEPLPLAVPEPVRVHGPVGDYPWPWWVGRAVPGVEIGHAEPDRSLLAEQVGDLLGRLHSPTLRDAVLARVPALALDPNGRADARRRAAWARETVDRAIARGLLAEPSGLESLLAEARSLPPPDERRTVLCHGDLHLRHVLVAPGTGGGATGVVDWGDACVGDRSLDLSFGYAALDGAERDRFLDTYAAAGGRRPDRAVELRARVLAVGLCAMLASTGVDLGDAGLVTENVRGIARALG